MDLKYYYMLKICWSYVDKICIKEPVASCFVFHVSGVTTAVWAYESSYVYMCLKSWQWKRFPVKWCQYVYDADLIMDIYLCVCAQDWKENICQYIFFGGDGEDSIFIHPVPKICTPLPHCTIKAMSFFPIRLKKNFAAVSVPAAFPSLVPSWQTKYTVRSVQSSLT